jgi:hypothetical protein
LVGDRVFGFDDRGWGGHAEHKVISENRMVATIPPTITYEQADSRGTSASTRSPSGRTDAPRTTARALTAGSSSRIAVTAGVRSAGE